MERKYEALTEELIALLEKDPFLMGLFRKSVASGLEINPDPDTNPIATVEDYFDLVDRNLKSLPWAISPSGRYVSLYDRIDQSMGIMYFVLEQEMEELKDKGYYHPSLIHHEPIRNWFMKLVKQYGSFLSTEDSWNEEYYRSALKEKDFHLDEDLYEDPVHWRTFNDFFSRKLKSPDKRPIAFPEDDRVLVSPCDGTSQGFWKIDEKGRVIEKEGEERNGVAIKTGTLNDLSSFLDSKEYGRRFACGSMSHSFLDINDYHRYHFPLSGRILDVKIIPGHALPGGAITWDKENKRYREYCSDVFGWQSLETRGIVIMETRDHHLAAICPLGMCQVSSVNFEKSVFAGAEVKKGDPLGYFLYGGSDIVMLFEEGLHFEMTCEKGVHLKMGEEYGRFAC